MSYCENVWSRKLISVVFSNSFNKNWHFEILRVNWKQKFKVRNDVGTTSDTRRAVTVSDCQFICLLACQLTHNRHCQLGKKIHFRIYLFVPSVVETLWVCGFTYSQTFLKQRASVFLHLVNYWFSCVLQVHSHLAKTKILLPMCSNTVTSYCTRFCCCLASAFGQVSGVTHVFANAWTIDTVS